MNTVAITTPRRRLTGKLIGAEDGRRPGLLFVHGWGASQRQDMGKAKRLAGGGFACLTFNLTGHARTRRHVGTVTRADNVGDVLAAYDFLAGTTTVDPERIGVVGSSYGGYLATLATAERKVRWLALQAPALYKDEDFARPKRELNLDPELPAFRRRVVTTAENMALERAARFRGEVLIVEAEDDHVIPRQVVLNYLAAFQAGAASVRHHVIKGADHGLSARHWRSAYASFLVAWLGAHASDQAR